MKTKRRLLSKAESSSTSSRVILYQKAHQMPAQHQRRHATRNKTATRGIATCNRSPRVPDTSVRWPMMVARRMVWLSSDPTLVLFLALEKLCLGIWGVGSRNLKVGIPSCLTLGIMKRRDGMEEVKIVVWVLPCSFVVRAGTGCQFQSFDVLGWWKLPPPRPVPS